MAFDDGPTFEEPAQPYGQDFTVSWTGLVSRTFTLWGRKLAQYIMIAFIPLLIFTLIEYAVLYLFYGSLAYLYIGSIATDPFTLILNIFLLTSDITFILITVIITITSVIISAIVAGAIYKFALDNYGAPDRGDVRESFSYASGRIVKLILVQLIISGISIGFMIPGIILLFLSVLTFDLTLIMTAFAAIAIGALVSFYITVRLAVAPVLVMAEENSVMDSIRRAYALAAGQFWHIFAGQILLALAVGVLGMIVGFLSLPLLIILGSSPMGALITYFLIAVIAGIFFTPLTYIFHAVLYRDLASRSEVTQQAWW
ncbi:MAG: hypothetical protein ACFFED_16635 [Candidatus Thorarchaeota archaeon]